MSFRLNCVCWAYTPGNELLGDLLSWFSRSHISFDNDSLMKISPDSTLDDFYTSLKFPRTSNPSDHMQTQALLRQQQNFSDWYVCFLITPVPRIHYGLVLSSEVLYCLCQSAKESATSPMQVWKKSLDLSICWDILFFFSFIVFL